MIAAFVAVAFQTFWNRLASQLRKLRQPRYAAGAIGGALYFWFTVIRNARLHGAGMWRGSDVLALRADILSVVVLTIIVLAWALPADSGGLDFTEAEIAFLFPAPLSRRNLILYKVVRSLPSAIVSSLIMSFVGLRGNFLGLWIGFTVLSVYFMMVALGRARLRLAGINFGLRIVGAIAVLAGLAFAATRFLPSIHDTSALHRGWASALLFVPGLFVSAAYPRSVVQFALTALALLAIGAVCFLGAVQLNVSFEEASLERSKRRAERRGRLVDHRGGSHVMFQRIQAPFKLAETGVPEIAIVWKNVIALLRVSLALVIVLAIIIAGIFVAGIAWPDSGARTTFAILLATLAALFPLLGPNFFRNDLRLDLARVEVLKSYPIAGDRLVAAEIAAPLVVISAFELACLAGASTLMNLSSGPARIPIVASPQFIVVALLLAVPICALQLLIRNAVPVLFPAWATRSKEDPRGFIMIGQRLVILAGNLLVLMGALLPAALVLLPSLSIAFRFFSGSPGLVAIGTLPSIAVIAAEVYFGTRMLGSQFDEIDVSADFDAITV